MRIAVMLGLALLFCPAARADEGWSRVSGPWGETPAAIGSAAAGCLAGAVALPPEGPGYQVLRLARKRNFGHPQTVRFVEALAGAAAAEGLGRLLVGDLSQPRGGPMPFGHGSHQSGLDVDIWFRLPEQGLAEPEREAPVPVSMVAGERVTVAWTAAQLRLLELAARAPEVDRIFVNPAIKREVCRSTGAERHWLAKLRPWWGHDEHFHVRLSCPPGSEACEAQKPVPDGDGCGAELASWFAKGHVPLPTAKPHHQTRPLPLACLGMLKP